MPQSALFNGIIPLSPPFYRRWPACKQGTAALIDDLIAAGVDNLFFRQRR